jgi:hypothetical protein
MKSNSQQRTGDSLFLLIDLWPIVADTLGVTIAQASTFVEEKFNFLKLTMWIDREYSGLWEPCEESVLSNMLIHLFNDAVSEKWDTSKLTSWHFLRLTPKDFKKIEAQAKKVRAQKSKQISLSTSISGESAISVKNDDGIDGKENSNATQTRIDALQEETLQLIQRFISEKPDLFEEYICKIIVLEDEQNADNPLRVSQKLREDEGEKNRFLNIRNRFRYLADLLLNRNSISIKGLPENGFISLLEYLEYEFSRNSNVWRYNSPTAYKGLELSDWIWTFFRQFEDTQSYISAEILEAIFRGLPIYKKNDAENYENSTSGSDYFFLKGCGEYSTSLTWETPPKWATEIHFKVEDFKLYRLIFFANNGLTPKEVEERKSIFSKHFDISEVQTDVEGRSSPRRGEETSLMKVLKMIQDRYYGINFNVQDSDTWPKQIDIVEWLMKDHKLSKRQAEALDIVCRPDAVRKR